MKVAVLGASPKQERYSNKAVRMLREAGHSVIPVNPVHPFIEKIPAVPSLEAIGEKVDTLTVYLGPRNLEPLIDAIIALQPGRVILNPGTESAKVSLALEKAEIPCLEACTLVLLRTNQF